MSHAAPANFTTQRLSLRQWCMVDAFALHQIMAERDLLRYFPNPEPPSIEKTSTLIDEQLNHWRRYGYGWWAVESRQTSGLIGWCGLQYLPETDEVEIAYLLGRSHWGHGYATEAASEGVRVAFEVLHLYELVAIIHPENRASRRVAARLGLSMVGEARYFGMNCHKYTLRQDSYCP